MNIYRKFCLRLSLKRWSRVLEKSRWLKKKQEPMKLFIWMNKQKDLKIISIIFMEIDDDLLNRILIIGLITLFSFNQYSAKRWLITFERCISGIKIVVYNPLYSSFSFHFSGVSHLSNSPASQKSYNMASVRWFV